MWTVDTLPMWTVVFGPKVEFYSRPSPCGHPSFVDIPPLWTLFPHVHDSSLCELRNGTIVCNLGPWPHLVSLVWTPRYCGHILPGPKVSTLPRFYCICKYLAFNHTIIYNNLLSTNHYQFHATRILQFCNFV